MKKVSFFLVLLLQMMFSACGGDDGVQTTTETVADDQDQDATTATIDSTYDYQLPVIFHVLYQDKNDASQYIPAARLKNLLEYVNQIYQGGVYGESANVHVKFVLAEKDESGNTLSTPGVEYVYYSGTYPIDESAFMVSADNKKYIWDPNEYINVMMFNFKEESDGEVLGISHMPYTIQGVHELEGLETTTDTYISKSRLGYPLCSSINSIYAGQSSTGGYYQSDRYTASDHQATYLTSADIVVTMAHELGHYLGLFHMFTENISTDQSADMFAPLDSCGDTDYCEDTPSYNRAEYNSYLSYYIANTSSSSLSVWDLLKRNACDLTTFYSANIMDYAFSLGYKISSDQKARIRNVLYYSPLIPGPKLNGANQSTRAGVETEGKTYDRPRLIR
ncbi:MAG: zinc-dependent metalloproteinase lipoprotein [Prevotella sp.]|nr:zinc-dependent metalloproteinase lipoprotein [Prevotella sp.]